METPPYLDQHLDVHQEQSQGASWVSTPDDVTGDSSIDQEMYSVLLAVERGELSPVEAAIKLDELVKPPSTEDRDAAGMAV